MNRTARDYAEKEAGRLTARKAASKPGKRSFRDKQKIKTTDKNLKL